MELLTFIVTMWLNMIHYQSIQISHEKIATARERHMAVRSMCTNWGISRSCSRHLCNSQDCPYSVDLDTHGRCRLKNTSRRFERANMRSATIYGDKFCFFFKFPTPSLCVIYMLLPDVWMRISIGPLPISISDCWRPEVSISRYERPCEN